MFGRVGLERDYLLILKHTCAGGCLVGVAAVCSGESGRTDDFPTQTPLNTDGDNQRKFVIILFQYGSNIDF